MDSRSDLTELLDAPTHDRAELADSLDQVAAANRLFGGTMSLLRHLARHVEEHVVTHGGSPPPFTILDVGTGNGTVAAGIGRWVADRGTPAVVTGIDSHPDVIGVARARARSAGSGFVLVRGDALRLPFHDRSFDVALCTLTLHHFRGDAAVRFVREMARIARRAVIVSDVERHALNYWAAKLLATTLWRRNRLTRHDGPLSVRRSFTMPELRAIGREAGLGAPRVRRHFPFRLVLEGVPTDDGDAFPEARGTR